MLGGRDADAPPTYRYRAACRRGRGEGVRCAVSGALRVDGEGVFREDRGLSGCARGGEVAGRRKKQVTRRDVPPRHRQPRDVTEETPQVVSRFRGLLAAISGSSARDQRLADDLDRLADVIYGEFEGAIIRHLTDLIQGTHCVATPTDER